MQKNYYTTNATWGSRGAMLNGRRASLARITSFQSIRSNFIDQLQLSNAKQLYGNICLFKSTVFRFMTTSSLLLALNGSMVVVYSSFLLGYGMNPDLLIAAFSVTMAVYSLNKVTDKFEDSINRPEIASKSPVGFLVVSAASMFAGLLIGISKGLIPLAVLVVPLAIGLIYSVKPSRSVPRIKDILGLKSLTVATNWALVGCLLPVSIYGSSFEEAIMVFLYIFIRVFVGTILCDMPDERGDLMAGAETIPIKLGRNRTTRFLVIFNSLAVLWIVYCYTRGLFLQFTPALIFGVLYGYLAIWYFSKYSHRLTGRLMLDSEWLPIVCIAAIFAR